MTRSPGLILLCLMRLSNSLFESWNASCTCWLAWFNVLLTKFNRASSVDVSLYESVLSASFWKGKFGCLKKVRKKGEYPLDFDMVELRMVCNSGILSCQLC